MTDLGGYRHCKCRDCFEVTMTTGIPEHDFCHACREAGCELDEGCQAPHTYCEADSRASIDVWGVKSGKGLVSPLFRGETARQDALDWGRDHSPTFQDRDSYSGWVLVQYCAVCGQEF